MYWIQPGMLLHAALIYVFINGYCFKIDMTLNCYVRPDRFDTLPSYPILLANGAEVHLVSNTRGTVKDIPGLSQIRSLSSFRYA